MKPDANILVLAPGGMLGRAMVEALSTRGIAHETAGRNRVDLASPGSIAGITPGFTHVINCAAYTAVDLAEEQDADATRINGHAVADLAARCDQIDAQLVHFGTDYVFNGTATEPYAVDHPRDPINAYGRSKAVGEEALEASGARYLYLRTSWLYAPWGSNFVLTMKKLTADKEQLKVVDDQRGRPTSCLNLARTTLDLLRAEAEGFLHATDGGACTWRGLTQAINDQLGHACDVQPCTTADFPRPAKRPAYSVLDLSETESILGPRPAWQDCLAEVLAASPGSAPQPKPQPQSS